MKISAAAICVVFCVGGGVSICSAEVQDRRVSFYEVSEESAQIVSLGWVLPPERMRWTKADGWLLSASVVSTSGDSHPFVSFGPLWQWTPSANQSWTVELSLQPTLLSDKNIGDRDMGSRFHFWSNLGIRWDPYDKPFTVALKIGHISNGSLYNHNPGADMIGLVFASAH